MFFTNIVSRLKTSSHLCKIGENSEFVKTINVFSVKTPPIILDLRQGPKYTSELMLKNKINKLTSKTRTSLTLNGLSQDSFLLCRCISNEKITITFKLVKKSKGLYRSSRPEAFCQKGVPRNFIKFTGKQASGQQRY